jgi:hypothetical protein
MVAGKKQRYIFKDIGAYQTRTAMVADSASIY